MMKITTIWNYVDNNNNDNGLLICIFRIKAAEGMRPFGPAITIVIERYKCIDPPSEWF